MMDNLSAEKPLTYDQITLGMALPELEFEISEERIKKYTDAIEDFNPIYFDTEKARASGFTGKVAPPTIAALFILKIYDCLGGQPDGTIHAKQAFHFFGPVYVGETLKTTGTVVKKHTKRGKQYIEVETTSLNSLNDKIVLGRSTFIWP